MLNKFSLLLLSCFTSIIVFSQTQNYTINVDGKRIYKNTSKELSQSFFEDATNSFEFFWVANPLDISANIGPDTWDPKMEIGADGTIHVVYNDNVAGYTNDQKIVYTKKNATTGLWSTPIVIDELNGFVNRNNHEPTLSVAKNGDIYVVYNFWAYDGSFRDKICYSHYDKATDTWDIQDTISFPGGGGTVGNTYPDISLAYDGNPIVVWGYDNRDSLTEEAYLTYYNGNTWSNDILISAKDTSPAIDAKIINLENNTSLIVFKEYSTHNDSVRLAYRIWNQTAHTLSPIKTFPETQYINPVYYYQFDLELRKFKGNSTGHCNIIYTIKDTIFMIDYDVINDTHSKSQHSLRTAGIGGYTDYKFIDLAIDNDSANIYVSYYRNGGSKKMEICKFDSLSGFQTPDLFYTTTECVDPPATDCDSIGNIHVVFGDDLFDTSVWLFRDIYYINGTKSATDINTVEENSSLQIFPNPCINNINIRINLIKEQNVIIEVYSTNGQLVKKLLNEKIPKGEHIFTLNTSSYNTEIYFIKYIIDTKISTQKFLKF